MYLIDLKIFSKLLEQNSLPELIKHSTNSSGDVDSFGTLLAEMLTSENVFACMPKKLRQLEQTVASTLKEKITDRTATATVLPSELVEAVLANAPKIPELSESPANGRRFDWPDPKIKDMPHSNTVEVPVPESFVPIPVSSWVRLLQGEGNIEIQFVRDLNSTLPRQIFNSEKPVLTLLPVSIINDVTTANRSEIPATGNAVENSNTISIGNEQSLLGGWLVLPLRADETDGSDQTNLVVQKADRQVIVPVVFVPTSRKSSSAKAFSSISLEKQQSQDYIADVPVENIAGRSYFFEAKGEFKLANEVESLNNLNIPEQQLTSQVWEETTKGDDSPDRTKYFSDQGILLFSKTGYVSKSISEQSEQILPNLSETGKREVSHNLEANQPDDLGANGIEESPLNARPAVLPSLLDDCTTLLVNFANKLFPSASTDKPEIVFSANPIVTTDTTQTSFGGQQTLDKVIPQSFPEVGDVYSFFESQTQSQEDLKVPLKHVIATMLSQQPVTTKDKDNLSNETLTRPFVSITVTKAKPKITIDELNDHIPVPNTHKPVGHKTYWQDNHKFDEVPLLQDGRKTGARATIVSINTEVKEEPIQSFSQRLDQTVPLQKETNSERNLSERQVSNSTPLLLSRKHDSGRPSDAEITPEIANRQKLNRVTKSALDYIHLSSKDSMFDRQTPVVQTPTPIPVKSIFEQIVEVGQLLIQHHKTKFQVSLKPEYLGMLTIVVEKINGKLRAKLIVEKAEVQQAIKAELPLLMRQFQDQGIKLHKIDVEPSVDHHLLFGDGQNNSNLHQHRLTNSQMPSQLQIKQKDEDYHYQEFERRQKRVRNFGYNTLEVTV